MESKFAYIKYEGVLVEDGYLDARKAGEALLGIDSTLKYFINYFNPDFQHIDYELPVRIHKGSWEAFFQENIDKALLSALSFWFAKQYVGPALSEMAKNDFKDVGFKDIFKYAFKGMTWVVKLATHLGTLKRKKFENIIFSPDNKFVGIKNEYDKILWFPIEYLESFANCPETLFVKLAKIIEQDRELVIGYNEKENVKVEVRVNSNNKFIFLSDEESEDILFPELKHNDKIELIGHITRGNEKSNTLGFLYEGHILTCFPFDGNIKNYRQALFNNCLMKGFIDRMDKYGQIQKRPNIKFTSIAINDVGKQQLKLF